MDTSQWILAHGLEPHGIWSCEASTPQAPPSAGLCAFASLTLEIVVQSPKDAIVFSSHCDQLRRTFDLACRHRSLGTFLFNLPATWKSKTAVRLFDSELERLGKFLLSLGGHEPSPQQLVELLSSYGAARRKLENARATFRTCFLRRILQMLRNRFFPKTPSRIQLHAVPNRQVRHSHHLVRPMLERTVSWTSTSNRGQIVLTPPNRAHATSACFRA